MDRQSQDEIAYQIARLREMLKAQHIRLEVQQASTPGFPSVRKWERLIKATEKKIQRLESHSPQK